MTVLTPPRHPLLDRALTDARLWCAGQVIDDRPALAHAVRVVVTLGEHIPDAAPELLCAALLHDAPEFAPADLDLDQVLAERYGTEVTRIVRALEAEHHALDTAHPTIGVDDLPVLLLSTADKIVALSSLLHRADKSPNPREFFSRRPALLALVPHFIAFRRAGEGRIPASMTNHLGLVLGAIMLTAGVW